MTMSPFVVTNWSEPPKVHLPDKYQSCMFFRHLTVITNLISVKKSCFNQIIQKFEQFAHLLHHYCNRKRAKIQDLGHIRMEITLLFNKMKFEAKN